MSDDFDLDLEATELDGLVKSGSKTSQGPVLHSRTAVSGKNHSIVGTLALSGAFLALVPGLWYPAVSFVARLSPAELVRGMRGDIDTMVKSELGGMAAMFGGAIDGMVDKLVLNPKLQQPVMVMSTTRSVLGSIHELFANGNTFVACLILVFSVCIPLAKLLLVLLAYCRLAPEICWHVGTSLSKWSMADVFAVGIFISMLATQGVSGQVLKFTVSLEPGFYCFALHTLLSTASTMVLEPVFLQRLPKQRRH